MEGKMKIGTLMIAVLINGSAYGELKDGELKAVLTKRTVTACVAGNDLRMLPDPSNGHRRLHLKYSIPWA